MLVSNSHHQVFFNLWSTTGARHNYSRVPVTVVIASATAISSMKSADPSIIIKFRHAYSTCRVPSLALNLFDKAPHRDLYFLSSFPCSAVSSASSPQPSLPSPHQQGRHRQLRGRPVPDLIRRQQGVEDRPPRQGCDNPRLIFHLFDFRPQRFPRLPHRHPLAQRLWHFLYFRRISMSATATPSSPFTTCELNIQVKNLNESCQFLLARSVFDGMIEKNVVYGAFEYLVVIGMNGGRLNAGAYFGIFLALEKEDLEQCLEPNESAILQSVVVNAHQRVAMTKSTHRTEQHLRLLRSIREISYLAKPAGDIQSTIRFVLNSPAASRSSLPSPSVFSLWCLLDGHLHHQPGFRGTQASLLYHHQALSHLLRLLLVCEQYSRSPRCLMKYRAEMLLLGRLHLMLLFHCCYFVEVVWGSTGKTAEQSEAIGALALQYRASSEDLACLCRAHPDNPLRRLFLLMLQMVHHMLDSIPSRQYSLQLLNGKQSLLLSPKSRAALACIFAHRKHGG